MFYIAVLIDREYQYIYSYHFTVHCKEYAKLFLSLEEANRYFRRSDFKHCKFKIVEIKQPTCKQ